ncbi:putative GTP-binding protein 2-like [Sesbania bispinosa]|nr:putative GTP-binding protein 2-like [Sesbania bispinosa]
MHVCSMNVDHVDNLPEARGSLGLLLDVCSQPSDKRGSARVKIFVFPPSSHFFQFLLKWLLQRIWSVNVGDAIGMIGVRDGVGITDSVAVAVPPVASGENATRTSSFPETDARGKAPIRVRKGRGKGKGSTTDESSSRPPVVEKKFNGSGSLLGYILKLILRTKKREAMILSLIPWVDPLILDTIRLPKSGGNRCLHPKNSIL